MAQSEAGRKNWEKVKGWAKSAADTVNSLPLTPLDPIKLGKDLTKYVSMPVRVGRDAQAAIDKKEGKASSPPPVGRRPPRKAETSGMRQGTPAGMGDERKVPASASPNAPRKASGPGPATYGRKAKSTAPNAPRKTGSADRATEPRKVGKAAPPSAGPKTKDGKPNQMPASAARSVPSGKAPVPKARPSGGAAKAKAAAKPPVPMARPQSGPQRKASTPPASARPRPPAASPVGGTPPQAEKPWYKKLLGPANTPFRRGPLASQDK